VQLGVRVSSLPRLDMLQLLNGVGASSYKNGLIDLFFHNLSRTLVSLSILDVSSVLVCCCTLLQLSIYWLT
jgi:hypothetical protein